MIGDIFIIGFSALLLIAYIMITKRLGYPWYIGFLVLIPGLNIIWLLAMAFNQSPKEKELKEIEHLVRASILASIAQDELED